MHLSPSTLLLSSSNGARNISAFLGPFLRVYRGLLPGHCSEGDFVASFVLFSHFYPRSVSPQVTSQFLNPDSRRRNSWPMCKILKISAKIRKKVKSRDASESPLRWSLARKASVGAFPRAKMTLGRGQKRFQRKWSELENFCAATQTHVTGCKK